MKKITIILVVIISVPFLIITFLNKDDEIEINYSLISKEKIRVKRYKKDIIEEISLEEYIVGVVAGEMPVSFHIEALKAQAIAARNYAIKKINYNKNNEYDVVDTTDNQVYLDLEELKEAWKTSFTKNINKIRKAVNETLNEVLVYNEQIIDLFYFSTSNGKTEDATYVFKLDVPYLKSVDSPWDKDENSSFTYQTQLNIAEFCKKINIICNDKIVISNIERNNSNRISSITINEVSFSGVDIYKLLKIRSTDFEINIKNDNVIITTKGFGHGVGMSQYGANGMANNGYNYKEILKHYYVGTKIKKIEI